MSPVVVESIEFFSLPGPFDAGGVFGWFAAHAVPGVVNSGEQTLSRSLRLPGGPAVLTATFAPVNEASHRDLPAEELVEGIRVALHLTDEGDRPTALTCVEWMFDLTADASSVDHHLAADPVLAPLVAARPGRRIPGAASAEDQAVLAVLGQQISVAAARTFAGRLVDVAGEPVPDALAGVADGVSHLFPTSAMLAEADLSEIGLTGTRQQTVRALASALASSRIDLSREGDPVEARERLLEVPGVGPWTADVIAIGALGDRDVLVTTDLVLRKAAIALGLPSNPRELLARSEPWAPYRSYASHHLWAAMFPDRAARFAR